MGLNHIYKVIWSKTKSAWVVVSELAKREGKSSVKSMISANGMRSAVACMVVMALGCGTAMGATEYGTGAKASGTNSIAIGVDAEAKKDGAVAIGADAKATEDGSVALGTSAKAGLGGISIGENANGEGISIGTNANATSNTIVIGDDAYSNRQNGAIILGHNSYTMGGEGVIAIGDTVIMRGDKASIAIGQNSMVHGDRITQIGGNGVANGADIISIGQSAVRGQYGVSNTSERVISIGNDNAIIGKDIIAIGQDIVLNEENQKIIAIGSALDITMTGRDGSVVLGYGSNNDDGAIAPMNVNIAGVMLDATKYAGNPNGTQFGTGGIVSIGKVGNERQIKHVAAGVISPTSTDAVNGSQLYHVTESILNNIATGTASTEKVIAATPTTGDTNLVTVIPQNGTAPGETYQVAVSGNAVKQVAQTAAKDAIDIIGNGDILVTNNTDTTGKKTYTVSSNTGTLVVDGTTGKVGATGATGAAGTVGKDGLATTQNVADVINDTISKVSANATHDFGGDTGTKVTRKHGEQLDIKGGVTNTADLTTGNIGVVTDPINGALNVRLAKVLNGLTSANFVDTTGNTTVVNGSGITVTPIGGGNAISVTTGGINAGGKEIKGIATGTTTDAAVNKGQLDAAITTALSNISGGAISTESVVAAAPTAGDTNLVTVTPQTGTKIGETYAVSVSGNAVKALATQAANQAINATNLNIAGDNTTGSVNVGIGVLKVAGSNGVETVANGSTITVGLDAATRNKIDNAATNAANGANKDLSNISPAGQQVIKDTAAWNMKVNGNAAETIKGGDTVTFNNGSNIEITQVGKDITVATKQDVTFNTITGVSTITGAGAGAPSISFNNPSGGTPSISVNAPIDMNGKTITNLADGVNPTDAVNKQQLDNAIMSVGGNPGLNDRVNKLSNRVDKVGAGAAALAALHPLDFDPDDKWNFAAGYGNYAGQNAMALGAFYRPNEDTLFSVSGTMGTGEDMVNAGVSFKLGQSSGVTNSRVAMAQEIKNLKNAVDIVLQQNQTLMKQNQVLAQTVSELSGKPIVSDGNFNDVPANHWAYGYVKALAQQGIIVGYEDGEFKGDRTMTRYELAAVIYRALQSGANIDADMKRAMDEFGPELEALRLADTFRIDRVSGDNNDRHKIDRVRVNNQTGRDVYGNHVQSK
ncbi:ESPR-type extended signal peptide-containing protein [Veillonella agrestimuris]|uniref:ESPR-type extended signal peptide-containing protein n=1 Tax=Veillonella agrestimuris TaxID=2941340 RepID=UPI002040620C|nr:ESPR-type extended signal peptide-containing protein [Veillonella agrestimuris]